MAVLNVRVEDHVRDQLKEMADAEGVTLSEYVRSLLLEAVVPVYEAEVKHGDEPAPGSMRTIDRQVLSLLHRILARVLPEDANDVDGDLEYQLERAKILEEGFAGEYWQGSQASGPSCPSATAIACPTSSRCSGSSPSAWTTSRRTAHLSTRSWPSRSSSAASTTTTR